MSPHDIIRFCGTEMGGEAKVRARDQMNHPSLIEELKHRIMTREGRLRWMNTTGLSSFVDWFERDIFTQVFPSLLFRC
jgi:hypothetical protein